MFVYIIAEYPIPGKPFKGHELNGDSLQCHARLYIFFFILAKRNCHSSNSCQIDNINIFLNKKQPFSKLKNLIPTSKYKTLKLTGYSWSITDPMWLVVQN